MKELELTVQVRNNRLKVTRDRRINKLTKEAVEFVDGAPWREGA